MAVTKSELIARLNTRFPDLAPKDMDAFVATILNELSDALIAGDRIELRGFGAFSVRKREPRMARNPKNGETVKVAERYSIYFRAGKELREKLNSED